MLERMLIAVASFVVAPLDLGAPPSFAQETSTMAGSAPAKIFADRNAFDFLVGDWRILNRRLKRPLTGSDEWTEFPARLEGSRKVLDGLVLMEQYKAELDGKPFEGLSVRVFDPGTGRWTIYWMDTNRLEMTTQVVGEFNAEATEFRGYGEELYAGAPVKMRFLWSDITARSARWEQAYYDEARESWETNWIMEFTRIEE